MDLRVITGLIGIIITISGFLLRALLMIHQNKNDIAKGLEDLRYVKASLKSSKAELKELISKNLSEIKEIVKSNKIQDESLEKRVNEMAQGLRVVETEMKFTLSQLDNRNND